MDGRVLAGNIILNTEEVRRGEGSFLAFRSSIQPRQTRAVRYCTGIVGTRYSGDTMGWMDYGKREEFYGCCYARTGPLWIYPGPWVRALLMLMPMLMMMMMMMVVVVVVVVVMVDTYPRRGQLFWETRDLPYVSGKRGLCESDIPNDDGGGTKVHDVFLEN